jgi:hypothetical protein
MTTRPDVSNTIHEVTYLPSELPPGFGEGHRFQLDPSSIRTANGDDIRSWYLCGTPFDFMGGQIPPTEIVGIISFTFNLIIPGAETIWTRKVERGADFDWGTIMYSKPFEYTMRHRFLLPQYSQA